MPHVHGVQNPVTPLVHVRDADDHRLRADIEPTHQMQRVVVDRHVIGVGIVRDVTDILEAVERRIGLDDGVVEELVRLVDRVGIDVGVFRLRVWNLLRLGARGASQHQGERCQDFSHRNSSVVESVCVKNRVARANRSRTANVADRA